MPKSIPERNSGSGLNLAEGDTSDMDKIKSSTTLTKPMRDKMGKPKKGKRPELKKG